MHYTVDATEKALGRLATEVSTLLLGKNTTTFAPNTVSTNTVTVVNASKMKVREAKLLTKTYNSYSGYPGGLKQPTMAHVVSTKGYSEVVMRAVKGMLPDNKLKREFMKHLTVTE